MELECTDFANKVDIGSITQIRVMSTLSNSARYLFNVKSVKKSYKAYVKEEIIFDLTDLNKEGLSYVINNTFKPAGDIKYNIESEVVKINKKSANEEILTTNDGEDYTLTIKQSIDTSDKNYVIDTYSDEESAINDTSIILNNQDDVFLKKYTDEEYCLDLSSLEKTTIEIAFFEYRLVLEKNEYTKYADIDNIISDDGLNVYILDYIQMSGRPIRKELQYSTYDDKGFIDEKNFVPNREKYFSYFNPFTKNIKINSYNPYIILVKNNYLLTYPLRLIIKCEFESGIFNIKEKIHFNSDEIILKLIDTKEFSYKFKDAVFVFNYRDIDYITNLGLNIEYGTTLNTIEQKEGHFKMKDLSIPPVEFKFIGKYIDLEQYLFFRLMKPYKEGDVIKNIIVLEDKYGKETNDKNRGYTGTELNIQYEIMIDDYAIPAIMYNESKEKDEINPNKIKPINKEEFTEYENPTFNTTFGEFNML